MKRCAFLSMDSLEGFYVYDHLTFAPLAELGWEVEEVSWRCHEHDWDQYDLVVIRSTWDYQDDCPAFMQTLETIARSEAQLANELETIRWNVSKDYLRELEQNGVPIVPTTWCEDYSAEVVRDQFAHFNSEEIIIKPLISANADDTFRLDKATLAVQNETLSELFSQRPFMIQPFMDSVINEGEYSLFYFDGDYSHCILKVPETNDFRVQEEHGGHLHSVEPEAGLLQIAAQTMATLTPVPLYARLDFVRSGDSFRVMEIELIEPSLYFNMDAQSAGRFARALDRRYG